MIRQPIRTLYSKNVTSTLSSTDTFTLPFSDFDGLVAKVVVSTLNSGSTLQLNLWLQSTDDGGTTYYDNVAFGTISGVISTQNALIATIPVAIGDGKYVSNITASATSGYVGALSGVPLLSTQCRLVWTYGTMTSTAVSNFTVSLTAQNQSPHA